MRIHHEATAIDLDAGEVEFLDEHAGTIDRIGYDELLIATGGEPIRPDLPGIDLPFIHGVQSLDDAQALLSLADEGCRRIVVVGGGYIGLEMAEAYIERGCTATVIERSAQPHGSARRRLRRARRRRHARRTASTCAAASDVEGFEPGAVLTSDGPIDADLVILGIGVRPRSELAAAAGIELGPEGRHARRRAPAHVGARRLVGRRLRRRRRTWSPASRCTSRSARTPTSTGGSPASTWPAATPGRRPVLGTAITKLCALEIALTGLRLDAGRRRRVRRRRHHGRDDDARRLPAAGGRR